MSANSDSVYTDGSSSESSAMNSLHRISEPSSNGSKIGTKSVRPKKVGRSSKASLPLAALLVPSATALWNASRQSVARMSRWFSQYTTPLRDAEPSPFSTRDAEGSLLSIKAASHQPVGLTGVLGLIKDISGIWNYVVIRVYSFVILTSTPSRVQSTSQSPSPPSPPPPPPCNSPKYGA